MKAKKGGASTVGVNKRAFHEYTIEERIEAGLVLQGWEVKSLRSGRVQLTEGYIVFKDNDAWLIGVHVPPLNTASTHIHPDPVRTRKLLLHRRELNRLMGNVQRKGYTLIPLSLYFKQGRAKLEVGIAKGKQQHDKRAQEKERSMQREASRATRHRSE